ncbi:hypothetical protein JTE90_021377 [Oedothorax gibbosus]|uniref:DNA ligase 3 BRCT domain-containing protein n=1 Tax=Oedothorax gibbosus TaxID=931172 RepID=A0AAV6VFT3_9ARAC|nr:hypothetical protein JTE90_021377 [Oedothorax gibbosus]
MPVLVLYQATFSALVSYSVLMTCLWFAGGVTLAMDDLKRAYSRKTQERSLVVLNEKELGVGRCLYERQSPVLSGCGLLHFTRNSTLVVTGTLLTYTMLLLNRQSYDGELLRDHEISESTHAICLTKDKTSAASKSAKQVTVDWLWDSMKLRKLLPTREYKPKH